MIEQESPFIVPPNSGTIRLPDGKMSARTSDGVKTVTAVLKPLEYRWTTDPDVKLDTVTYLITQKAGLPPTVWLRLKYQLQTIAATYFEQEKLELTASNLPGHPDTLKITSDHPAVPNQDANEKEPAPWQAATSRLLLEKFTSDWSNGYSYLFIHFFLAEVQRKLEQLSEYNGISIDEQYGQFGTNAHGAKTLSLEFFNPDSGQSDNLNFTVALDKTISNFSYTAYVDADDSVRYSYGILLSSTNRDEHASLLIKVGTNLVYLLPFVSFSAFNHLMTSNGFVPAVIYEQLSRMAQNLAATFEKIRGVK